MSSLRILHLVSYSLFSGPVPPTVGLALAQRRAGHRVWLAFDSKRGAFNDYEEAAAPRLQDLQLAPPVPLTLSAKSSPGELWADWRGLRRLWRQNDLDVLHVHLSHDHLLTRWSFPPAQLPLVRTFHADRSLERRLGQTQLNRRATGWIVRSERHRALLAERFGIAGERVAVIPSGIDAEFFAPPTLEQRHAARARFGIPDDAVVVAQVALIAGRGQEELAGALVRVNSPRLHVLYVGEGENAAPLRLMVQSIGLAGKAHFAGYLAGEALLDAYAAMDVAFVGQPGNDASARAALEALACAKPVLAVQRDALGETITSERGFPLVDRDPEHIAAALRQVLADPAGREQRGQAGRAYVLAERHFAGEAAATLALYDRARAAVLPSSQTRGDP